MSSGPASVADALQKYAPRRVAPRQAVPTAEAIAAQLPGSSRPASRAAAAAAATTRFSVPPLQALALDALVRGFEARPSLRGIPAKFAAAVAQRLPADLDVRLTVPAVHDDNYWRRVCEEAWGWGDGRVELAEHGYSWKQAFCELFVARELERLGDYSESQPLGWEEEFCRPPIDSTHPRWPELYRRMAPARLDGKPNRERFAATALDEGEIDSRILSSADCGWPYLERLKALVKANQAQYEASYAWAGVDKAAHLAKCAAEDAAAEKARKLAADAAAGIAPPPEPGADGKDAGAAGGAAGGAPTPPSLLAVPYSVAAARERDEALKAAQRAEDQFDCKVPGAALREFVTPEVLAAWKATTAWPPGAERGDSVLAARARELQTVLDKVQSCEDHVFRLVLRELPSHLDLELVASRLPNLSSLELQYAPRRLGMRVGSDAASKALATMQPADAEALARVLKQPESLLTSLALPCDGIDDGLLAILMQGLLASRTLTHLDLSANQVGDAGAALLARMLRAGAGACVLSSLRLADNRLGARAAESLGGALRRHDCFLAHLDLRRNALTDAGGAALLDGLLNGGALRTLVSLNLSNCGLGPKSAAALAAVLAAPGCALANVALAANSLGDAEVALIEAALASGGAGAAAGGNTTVCALDLRANAAASPAAVAAVSARVFANEVRARGGQSAPLLGAYKKAFEDA